MRTKPAFQAALRAVFCSILLITLITTPTDAHSVYDSQPLQSTSAGVPGDPDAPGFLERAWTLGAWDASVGSSGLYVEDINSDGVEEVVAGGEFVWQVFSYSAVRGGYQIKYTSKNYEKDTFNRIGCLVLANLGSGVGYRIFVAADPNVVEVYDGSLKLIDSFTTPFAGCETMQVADVDHDGVAEIVAGRSNQIYVLSALTYETEWISPVPGVYIDIPRAVGNVDDDPQLEIITNFMVIDGLTHEVEWKPDHTLGYPQVIVDIDQDGRGELITIYSYNRIVAYDVEIKATQWTINAVVYGYQSLTAQDIDGDGVIEIVTGNDQWGSIRTYDSLTRDLEWSIENPDSGAVRIVVDDLDNDGVVEAVWGANTGSTAPDRILIGDTVTHQIEWRSSESGQLIYTDAGDVDADGQTEILASGCYDENGVNGFPMAVLDFLTKELEWAGPSPMPSILSCDQLIKPLGIANIDQDPALEILISQEKLNDFGSYVGVIQAYDGKTHLLEWESPGFEYYEFGPILGADVDQDGQVEVIAGQYSSTNGFKAPYLYIYDPVDDMLEWKSPVLTAYDYMTNGVMTDLRICNLDGDPNPEIVTSGAGDLVVFDGKTHAVQWQNTSLWPSSVDCGDLDADGDLELAVGRDSENVTILDGQTGAIEKTIPVLFDSANINNTTVTSTIVDDFDQDGKLEILVGNAASIGVVDPLSNQKIWESELLGNRKRWGLRCADIDGDGFPDVLTGTEKGIFLFRHDPEENGNVKFTPSFSGDRSLSAPGGVVTYHAGVTSQEVSPRGFRVSLPLPTGSGLSGIPVPSIGQVELNDQTVEWSFTLDPGDAAGVEVPVRLPDDLATRTQFGLIAYYREGAAVTALTRTVVTGLDTHKPVSAIAQPAPGAIVSNTHFTVSGTASDDLRMGRVEVSLAGEQWQTATGTASWNYDLTLPDADGEYTILYRAVDDCGNVETAHSQTVHLISPVLTMSSISDDSSLQYGGNLALNAVLTVPGVQAVPAVNIVFNDSDQILGEATTDGSGAASLLPASPLTPGGHAVTASFGGTAAYKRAASTPLNLEIVAANTVTLITSDLTLAIPVDHPLVIHVKVMRDTAGVVAPNGKVILGAGANGCVIDALTPNGNGLFSTGSCEITFTGAGTKTLSAAFRDPNHRFHDSEAMVVVQVAGPFAVFLPFVLQ